MHTPSNWRQIQRRNFTDWKRLLAYLHLTKDAHSPILTESRFALNLPERIAKKIEKGNWQDPLLLQFLPTMKELERDPAFSMDPVQDMQIRKTSKLLHKYRGRALLVCTGACVMNCRFCFRQHFDYEREDKTFDAEIEAISKDTSLSEIILSGGDPLSLSDEILSSLIQKLSQIPHLKRLRFHTRFPIGIPERIDDSFLSILRSTRLQTFFVIHCNHPRELDEEILASLKKIQQLGCPVLCQSVLLKRINDNLETLQLLCERLINAGVIIYNLNQLDRVQGASHFEVPVDVGISLINALRTQLPGYGLFSYVADIPSNQLSKTSLI
jgi:EF-P beta-lysylation protein EpmB